MAAARWRPALTNLGRRKPRGAWIRLWGKCAVGQGRGCDWHAVGGGASTRRRWSSWARLVDLRPMMVLRFSQVAVWGVETWRFPTEPAAAAGGLSLRWAGVYRGARSLGGARDIGFWPRRKISMMRMGPPQQGHGSRRVCGTISATGSACCSGRVTLTLPRDPGPSDCSIRPPFSSSCPSLPVLAYDIRCSNAAAGGCRKFRCTRRAQPVPHAVS